MRFSLSNSDVTLSALYAIAFSLQHLLGSQNASECHVKYQRYARCSSQAKIMLALSVQPYPLVPYTMLLYLCVYYTSTNKENPTETAQLTPQ